MKTSAALSTRCGLGGGGLLKPKADVEDQAQALAAHMVSPKIIRVLTHTVPNVDVLTGKYMKLAEEMTREDDGKTIEDDLDLESESSDDGFSTSSE